MTETKKKIVHYVDNKKLFAAMCDYRDAVQKADPENPPAVTHYIGECIMKIATHLAYRPNFANYPFREEMIGDGIENCLRYIDNWDPNIGKNPFAYFTTTIYFAFIRRIKEEKKYLYKKHAATLMADLNNMLSAQQEHDRIDYKNDPNHGEWSQEQMLIFMENFEKSKMRRRRKPVDGEEAAPVKTRRRVAKNKLAKPTEEE